MRYLDPKNDLTFKKIFGQNPLLLKSFLNALMPFEEEQYIESLEYLNPELVPEIPVLKNSIVDVRCVDNNGRQFIIEMQMLWTDSFKSRVLFNASKAYVSQIDKGIKFESLCPVYSLNLINDIYLKDDPDYYHHYSIVNIENSAEKIDGLEFIFIELPKFKPTSITEKRMAVLWLRFLTEYEENLPEIQELRESEEIQQAILILDKFSYSPAELAAYEKYWDAVRTERSMLSDSEKKGIEKGIKLGEAIGEARGEARGERNEAEKIAVKSIEAGLPNELICRLTGLTADELSALKMKMKNI